MLKLKLGVKGELVIPKKIRDSLGFKDNVILTIHKNKIELAPENGEEILNKWEKFAKEHGVDVTKELIYGDKLYEEVF